MTLCYFTATGNCLYVARRIGGELRSIPHMMKDGTMDVSDDAVGIVCPVYAGQMKAERSEARFRNEHVTLKDIIASDE